MSKLYADLRKMTKDELVKNHDIVSQKTMVGISYWLNEIERRDREDHEKIMFDYTKQIKTMTLIMTIATILNIFISILVWCL
ncbi:MAG: hypothetical protein AB7T10_05000 [bacterium]